MGNSMRKFFRAEDEKKYSDTLPGIGCAFEDPRSPTDGIYRTPIVFEKKPYLETDLDAVTPPCHPRIHRLQKEIDPRSPSSTIDRTPLSILGSYETNDVFESPISLYSRYDCDQSAMCLPSPAEPSVNVSDFENEHFNQELVSIGEQFGQIEFRSDVAKTSEEYKFIEILQNDSEQVESTENEKLWKKRMCMDLMNEIIESFNECQVETLRNDLEEVENEKHDLINEVHESLKECQDIVDPRPEPKSAPKQKSFAKKLSLSSSKQNSKPLALSTRAPLSNITSAGNTPTKLSARKVGLDKSVKIERTGENTPTKLKLRKDEKNVIVAGTGENSPINTSNKKYHVQWDHDSTVVI